MPNQRLKSLIFLSSGEKENKNAVWMELFLFGRDLILCIGGGEVHLGSVASTNGFSMEQFTLDGHKEDELVADVLKEIAEVTEREVLVIGGIHYDQIQPEQIEEILTSIKGLTSQLKEEISALKLDFHFE